MDRFSNFVQEPEPQPNEKPKFQYTAPQEILDEVKNTSQQQSLFQKPKPSRLDDGYKNNHQKAISPTRIDPYAKGGDQTPDVGARSYINIMIAKKIEDEQSQIVQKTKKIASEQPQKVSIGQISKNKKSLAAKMMQEGQQTNSEWEKDSSTNQPLANSKWETPRHDTQIQKRNRWETPLPDQTPMNTETPLNPNIETPKSTVGWNDKTPMAGQTPQGYGGQTPSQPMMTPSGQIIHMTHDQLQQLKYEKELEERNRYLTDEELDQVLPGVAQGYEIVRAPENYKPTKNPIKKYMSQQNSSTPLMYQIPESTRIEITATPSSSTMGNLPSIKPEEYALFSQLLQPVDESELSSEQLKERKVMAMLLKIKNGTPQMRKSGFRQINLSAKELGPNALFNQILPLLMSPTLDDQERHLLVKVIDRVLYKLEDQVRPYVHKILVVIQPMLIHEDYYARVEAREIISNLAKAAGLATMITTMRPDIDHNDDFVRNTTARAFAIVGSALGIPQLLPFLKAVCQSRKSWQARQTGIKVVQQIAIFMGCAVLPHLKSLVEIIQHGLKDEQHKVRTISALAISALAEASAPYGIEAFDCVLIPLWEGLNQHRGKALGAFLKATGYVIPLMDQEHANDYTKEVMPILIREFSNQEEEMKKIVLMVVKQCVSSAGLESNYVRNNILPEFFKNFWVRRMALDRRNYKQLIETTVELGCKVGAAEIIDKIVEDLKDENENYRKMVMEAIEKIVSQLGVPDVDSKLEQKLMDCILWAFHEQQSEDTQIMLNGFATVVNSLGTRAKPYFGQICGILQWRLSNKTIKVRMQAADLVSKIAQAMKNCGEDIRLGRLGQILYESLNEEYPEVLGSILGGLKAIVNVIGMTKMTPPIKDLLPRLTPILKNRHEKVQENCIDLVGRIADRGSEFVSPKEWIRICFDLLDMLKAHKKCIRRATINTFAYIAKAIGPQDVLSTLLNNLKVQERQLRVCTTVAIAIVAETCGPFTVLPALMNEYRVQELNVQNGVLKALAFMFEYIGEMAKDYINAIIPLLDDALTDRDLVHRQIASSAIKHLALGVQCLGCEEQLVHLLNFVWPNIFETSPHVIMAVSEAIEGMRVSLGPGLWHPARRVRHVYWRIYNMLYVGSCDSLNAFYPSLLKDEENNNDFTRYELLPML